VAPAHHDIGQAAVGRVDAELRAQERVLGVGVGGEEGVQDDRLVVPAAGGERVAHDGPLGLAPKLGMRQDLPEVVDQSRLHPRGSAGGGGLLVKREGALGAAHEVQPVLIWVKLPGCLGGLEAMNYLRQLEVRVRVVHDLQGSEGNFQAGPGSCGLRPCAARGLWPDLVEQIESFPDCRLPAVEGAELAQLLPSKLVRLFRVVQAINLCHALPRNST